MKKVSYVKGGRWDYTRGVYREGVCPALEVPQQRPGAVDRPPPRGADVIGDVLREVAVRVENALASGFRLPVAVRVRFPNGNNATRERGERREDKRALVQSRDLSVPSAQISRLPGLGVVNVATSSQVRVSFAIC